MAGLTVVQRELADTQQRLGQWFEQALRERVAQANQLPVTNQLVGKRNPKGHKWSQLFDCEGRSEKRLD
jgi:hypothetical protein